MTKRKSSLSAFEALERKATIGHKHTAEILDVRPETWSRMIARGETLGLDIIKVGRQNKVSTAQLRRLVGR
jgi:hypothetical protein